MSHFSLVSTRFAVATWKQEGAAMKALNRRLERLENARSREVNEWGESLIERLQRGLKRLRDAGLERTPAPDWVRERFRLLNPAR